MFKLSAEQPYTGEVQQLQRGCWDPCVEGSCLHAAVHVHQRGMHASVDDLGNAPLNALEQDRVRILGMKKTIERLFSPGSGSVTAQTAR